ncbi:MAG: hypothetical protein JO250_12175 [Armatimonadetes bacterium]|nr:hypothetical protein [Armatimonadota bacterium]
MSDNPNLDTAKADNTLTRHETEPATKHDVKEGGALGAVGGAVVGALAGGPVGAVIGAAAGGAASAGAVDVVDKHDDDFDKTVAKTGTEAA